MRDCVEANMFSFCRNVLSHILSDLPPDERIARIHSHLERVADDLKSGKVPLSLLSITKQLTKNPEEYADPKSQPHVQVAMRFNSRGGKKLRAGDTVSYVICEVRIILWIFRVNIKGRYRIYPPSFD